MKLPSNVRVHNLRNFPTNHQTVSNGSKRAYSSQNKKQKITQEKTVETSLKILEQNLQYIFNEKLKSLAYTFKTDFIEPALKSIRQNSTKDVEISENDVMFLVLNLIEKSKQQFKDGQLSVLLQNDANRTDNKMDVSKRKCNSGEEKSDNIILENLTPDYANKGILSNEKDK